jgi:hypothetical protein
MLSQFTLGRTRDPVSHAVFRHDETMHSRVARKLVIATTRWSSVGQGLCSVARFGVYATLRRRGKRKLNGVHGATMKNMPGYIFALHCGRARFAACPARRLA